MVIFQFAMLVYQRVSNPSWLGEPSLRFRFSKFGKQLMMAEIWPPSRRNTTKNNSHDDRRSRLRRDDITRSIWKRIATMTSMDSKIPKSFPICSMHGIFTYIWVILMVYIFHTWSIWLCVGGIVVKSHKMNLGFWAPKPCPAVLEVAPAWEGPGGPHHWFWRFPDVEISSGYVKIAIENGHYIYSWFTH